MARGKNAIAAANRRARMDDEITRQLKDEILELKAKNTALGIQIVAERQKHLAQVHNMVETRTREVHRECRQKVDEANESARAFVAARMMLLYSWYAFDLDQIPVEALKKDGKKAFAESGVDDFSGFQARVLAIGGHPLNRSSRRTSGVKHAALVDEINRYRQAGGVKADTLQKMMQAVNIDEQEAEA